MIWKDTMFITTWYQNGNKIKTLYTILHISSWLNMEKDETCIVTLAEENLMLQFGIFEVLTSSRTD